MKHKRYEDRKFLDHIKEHPCCICGKWPSDPAHIRTRGAGGDDKPHNVIPLCRLHHVEQHKMGFVKMTEKYPLLKRKLLDMGWMITQYGLYHDELETAYS